MPKTSKKTTSGRGSPSEQHEPLEERDVDPLDQDPEQHVPGILKSKKKKKKKDEAEDDDAEHETAAPPKKKKKKKDEAEDEGAAEEKPEKLKFDVNALRKAIAPFRTKHTRKPHAKEMAKLMDIALPEALQALEALEKDDKSLSNQRRRAKVNGYKKLAVEAGYGYTDKAFAPIDRGDDSLYSIISLFDVVRLATFVPLTPEAVSFDESEFKQRLELMTTTLPEGAAREVVANVEPVFKWIINQAVSLTIQERGAQRVQPSAIHHVLKPFADRMAFSSVQAPPGLVKFFKDEAPPTRGEYPELDLWKRQVAEYKARVPLADRGMGRGGIDGAEAAEEDEAVEAEKKLAKDNDKAAKKNGATFKKYDAGIKKEKKEKKMRAQAAKQAVPAQ